MRKKILAIFIVAIYLTTHSYLAVFAAADENHTAENGEAKTIKGTVTETGENGHDTGVEVISGDPEKPTSLDVTGGVEVRDNKPPEDDWDNTTYGVKDTAYSNTGTVNVGKDVEVDYKGKTDNVSAVGVYTEVIGGDANVRVGGSVSAKSPTGDATGIDAVVNQDTPEGTILKTDITVKGSVNAETPKGNAVGIETKNLYGNSDVTNVTVNKDVNVKNSADDRTSYGIHSDMSGEQSNTTIDIGGNINVNGKPGSAGMVFDYDESKVYEDPPSSKVNVRVKGDVNSNQLGIIVDDVANGKVDVVIEGTLSADNGPAVVINKEASDDFTLTAWRVDAPKDLVMENTGTVKEPKLENTKVSQLAENKIQYIIKVEPTQAGSITLDNTTIKYFTDANGNITKYDTAREGEKVAVKLAIPDGYSLYGVYRDDDQRLPLNVDSNGNYYLVVPRGGGVIISMTLVKDEPDPEPTTTATPTPYDLEDKNKSSSKQGTYTIVDVDNATNSGIPPQVLQNAYQFAEDYAVINCPDYLTGERRQAFLEYFVMFFRNLLMNYNGETNRLEDLEEKATDLAELAVWTMN